MVQLNLEVAANEKILTITVGAVIVLGCFSGAGLRGSSAMAQGHPGANCKSDNDCGSRFLVCTPQCDGTLKCSPSNQPVYDPPGIGTVQTCHTDADCPAGYSCVRTGGLEEEDKTLGNCSLPTGVTQ